MYQHNSYILIKTIRTDSHAYISGLAIDDEIISIGGYRLKSLLDLERFIHEEQETEIIYSRRGLIGRVMISPNSYTYYDSNISDKDDSTNSTTTLRNNWLKFILV